MSLTETRRRLRTVKGFTLIELLIVIVVLGILSGIAILAIGAFAADATNQCGARSDDVEERAGQWRDEIGDPDGVYVTGGDCENSVMATPTPTPTASPTPIVSPTPQVPLMIAATATGSSIELTYNVPVACNNNKTTRDQFTPGTITVINCSGASVTLTYSGTVPSSITYDQATGGGNRIQSASDGTHATSPQTIGVP